MIPSCCTCQRRGTVAQRAAQWLCCQGSVDAAVERGLSAHPLPSCSWGLTLCSPHGSKNPQSPRLASWEGSLGDRRLWLGCLKGSPMYCEQLAERGQPKVALQRDTKLVTVCGGHLLTKNRSGRDESNSGAFGRQTGNSSWRRSAGSAGKGEPLRQSRSPVFWVLGESEAADICLSLESRYDGRVVCWSAVF